MTLLRALRCVRPCASLATQPGGAGDLAAELSWLFSSKNFGPERRTGVAARPLGPAREPSRAPSSTSSQSDALARRLTVLHPPASADRGAGITKGGFGGPKHAEAGKGLGTADVLTSAFALANSFATLFAWLTASTASWSRCGKKQLPPLLHSPFRKNRQ